MIFLLNRAHIVHLVIGRVTHIPFLDFPTVKSELPPILINRSYLLKLLPCTESMLNFPADCKFRKFLFGLSGSSYYSYSEGKSFLRYIWVDFLWNIFEMRNSK